MSVPKQVSEYTEKLREWQRRVCEHLGMDPEQVFQLHDYPESYGARRLEWKATDPQEPNAGNTRQWRESGGWDLVYATGETHLRPEEWESVIAAAGPKPEMFTPEQERRLEELVLRGTIRVGDQEIAPIPPVDSIVVKQDVGGPYPRFKRVTLDLFADGSVRWRDLEEE